MNTRNKAKELIGKMFSIGSLTWCEAIECAIISVEEILNLNHPNVIVSSNFDNNNLDQMTQQYYWEQVKEEILKIQKFEVANGNIYFNKPDHIVNKQLELF